MPHEFTLTSAYLGADAYVLTVEGELDVATAPRLRDELAAAAQDGALSVIVDLLRVPFVDSVGMGALVEASKRLRLHGGALSVVCDDRRLVRVFEITGLSRALRFHTTLREALVALPNSDGSPLEVGA